MMDWRDEGVLLTIRRHGESAAIINALTREHGRHAGVLKGGSSQKLAPLYQPGAQMALEWSARLEAHIGTWRAEVTRSRAGPLMASGDALAAMGSISALLIACIPERAPCPALYDATVRLLELICEGDDWPPAYVGWEAMLLSEAGFPLDLSSCALTGTDEDLIWVSPRSGRAVNREAGAPWAAKLLTLPGFFRGEPADAGSVAEGLKLTGWFLTRWVAPAMMGGRPLPAARERLVRRLTARAG